MSDAPATPNHSPIDAILLAGGKGARLHPYTAVLPKPLMPLGDMPVLEILIRRLRRHNLHNLAVCTGHFAELIQAFFGDGRRFGVDLSYTREERPLGTAGPIQLVNNLASPFVVMNGDLLTTLDFSRLIAHHRSRKADATIAIFPRTVTVDFGVIDIDDADRLCGYNEKPVLDFHVSMGVYVFERHVAQLVQPGDKLDIPELISRIRTTGGDVCCFRSDCFWLDIGRPDDYARAQEHFERDRTLFIDQDDASWWDRYAPHGPASRLADGLVTGDSARNASLDVRRTMISRPSIADVQ